MCLVGFPLLKHADSFRQYRNSFELKSILFQNNKFSVVKACVLSSSEKVVLM